MQDLNFRKRRRKQARKKQKMKKQGLRFETGKPQLRFRKEKTKAQRQKAAAVVNWTVQIAITCMIAFVLVWFFGQRVSNAGDSMKPVLQNGDVVLVNRLIYNASKPKRGDIIAFKPNGNENTHYSIKRVVGLPGETVQIKDGSVYINGTETLEHIFAEDIEEAGIAEEPVILDGTEYFVLGDNHLSSDDSRMADIGNVKRSEIYGKVWFVASFGSDFGFVKR
ncbi:signal peptidase I [Clostridium sp. AF19-22AC]|jgi:signal peptidase I|uniref:signal peptidase I n=1 Tax=Clostridia TaxID=186801 RepID=UPI000E523D8E|nr:MULTISPECIES: signal peptidase I [Clostridia]RHR27508.1 signal peptidase I [Clostridium sp. AF19-22AC]